LVVTLFEQVAEQPRMIAALRDEIARLKGGPCRPDLKPSGMEKATEPDKPAGPGGGKRGSTKSKLTIHEEKLIKADAPPGSRFKGYTSFVVQELAIHPDVINFRCEHNVAEWIAAFRLAGPHGAAVRFVYCSPKPASRRFGNGRGLECGKLLDLDGSGALNIVAGNPTTQMPHRLGAGFL
jgi:hypothetical protein